MSRKTVRAGNDEGVRVLSNKYDNPITIGRVYRVHEWRWLRGEDKPPQPRIYDDIGRTITLDDTTYEPAVLPQLKNPSPRAARIVRRLNKRYCPHAASSTGACYRGIDCDFCIGNAIDAAVKRAPARGRGGRRAK